MERNIFFKETKKNYERKDYACNNLLNMTLAKACPVAKPRARNGAC